MSRLPSAVGLILGVAAAVIAVKVGGLLPGLPVLTWGLVGVATAVAVLGVGWRRLGGVRLNGLHLAFLGYIAIRLSVELINAIDLRHPVSPQLVIDLSAQYMAFFSASLVVRSPRELSAFLRALTVPVLFLAPLAVAQILNLPGVGEWIIQNTVSPAFERRFLLGYEIRGTALLGHHTQFGGFLVALTGAMCVDLIISRRLKRSLLTPGVLLAFVVIAQITTLTFATVGASGAIIVATLFALGLRPGPIVLLAATSAVGLAVFGGNFEERIENQSIQRTQELAWLPETIAYRVGIWTDETWPAIGERPLFGWGHDVYSAYEKGWPVRATSLVWGSPESEYMRVLVTGGLLSFLGEAVLIIATFVALRRVARRFKVERFVVPVVTTLCAILVISVIHNHLSSYGAPLVLWPLVGAMVGLGSGWRAQENPDGHNETAPKEHERSTR